MIVFLFSVLAWAVPAAAVLVLLARGRRRRDQQHSDRQRALAARTARHAAAHARHTPRWARTDHHRRDR